MKPGSLTLLAVPLALLCAPAAAQSWEIFSAARDMVRAATVAERDILLAARRAVQQKDAREPAADGRGLHAARLQRLAAPHAAEDGLALNMKAYQSASPTVFATADGSLRLTTGLMDLLDDDELRAVIGHHIGHLKLGHALGTMRSAYMSEAAGKLAAGAGSAQGYGASMAARELGQMLEKALKTRFSQAQEHAADDYARTFMERHGYRATALESAAGKLAGHVLSHNDSALHPDPAAPGRARQDGM